MFDHYHLVLLTQIKFRAVSFGYLQVSSDYILRMTRQAIYIGSLTWIESQSVTAISAFKYHASVKLTKVQLQHLKVSKNTLKVRKKAKSLLKSESNESRWNRKPSTASTLWAKSLRPHFVRQLLIQLFRSLGPPAEQNYNASALSRWKVTWLSHEISYNF